MVIRILESLGFHGGAIFAERLGVFRGFSQPPEFFQGRWRHGADQCTDDRRRSILIAHDFSLVEICSLSKEIAVAKR